MFEDYHKPGTDDNPSVVHDCQGGEGECKPMPAGTKQDECFISPATMRNVFLRLPELITDPSCNELSASRFVFFWVGLICGFIAIHETIFGRAATITTMITTVMATAATVYFASTVKDWRWRRRDREGGND